MTPLGKNSWKPRPGFQRSLSHEPFPFADFTLYSFAVINHNCAYMSTTNRLSLMGTLSKSLPLGSGLEDAQLVTGIFT